MSGNRSPTQILILIRLIHNFEDIKAISGWKKTSPLHSLSALPRWIGGLMHSSRQIAVSHTIDLWSLSCEQSTQEPGTMSHSHSTHSLSPPDVQAWEITSSNLSSHFIHSTHPQSTSLHNHITDEPPEQDVGAGGRPHKLGVVLEWWVVLLQICLNACPECL